ncbi:hypothetical protein Ciccas_004529 [Cichlidogyrus casuarinus]|uniref:glycerol kinase n=1 Tax=Cichlidogyrus casuarinus TaxID=1844966 RepID=A0ABD2QBC8_9PLAT
MLIASIDQGTTSTKVIVYEGDSIVAQVGIPINKVFPSDGWIEEDPDEIYSSVVKGLNECLSQIDQSIMAVGITNQRESTIAWSKSSGKPFYNAIIWCDSRTCDLVKLFLTRYDHLEFNEVTGLPLHSYFSAFKMLWLLQNVEEVKKAAERNDLCLGTVDSWLVWNLTDGKSFITDVTNASRTSLMNIKTCKWDKNMLELFGISENWLPEIVPSSGHLATITDSRLQVLSDCPIQAILGDQQAALFAQSWDAKNKQTDESIVKVTFGTGAFILWNIGKKCELSRVGLITTVAYKLTADSDPVYALEGSVAFSGATIDWLWKNVGIIKDFSELEERARIAYERLSQDDPCYFVPAFSGLLCPYWTEDARGLLIGLQEGCDGNDIILAALRSSCYQIVEVLECATSVTAKLRHKPKVIMVDGGVANNNVMLQSLADLTGLIIKKPASVQSMTALGVAMLASHSLGISIKNESKFSECALFQQSIDDRQKQFLISQWKKAVKRSLNWTTKQDPPQCPFRKLSNKLTPFLFGLATAFILMKSKKYFS